MPGTVENVGVPQARWMQGYQEKYKEVGHVVVAFKSVKAEFGMTQVQEYETIGYKAMEDATHPDGVVMVMPWPEYNAMKAAERELGSLPVSQMTDSRTGQVFDNPTKTEEQRPMSRQQMKDEFGVADQGAYKDSDIAEALEE